VDVTSTPQTSGTDGQAPNEARQESSDDIADDEAVTKLYNILHRRDPESEVMIRQFSGRKISIFSRAH